MQELRYESEDREMHECSGGTDRHEHDEADRDETSDELIGEQHAELPSDELIEFALAACARAHLVGNFAETNRSVSGHEEIEEDLEPLARHSPNRPVEERPTKQEETAHRILQGRVGGQLGDPRRYMA